MTNISSCAYNHIYRRKRCGIKIFSKFLFIQIVRIYSSSNYFFCGSHNLILTTINERKSKRNSSIILSFLLYFFEYILRSLRKSRYVSYHMKSKIFNLHFLEIFIDRINKFYNSLDFCIISFPKIFSRKCPKR